MNPRKGSHMLARQACRAVVAAVLVVVIVVLVAPVSG
jgi:hypothetical protein